MNFYLEIISAAVAYLLGSISFARIVTYISTSGKDITEHEIPVDGTDESYKVLSIGANSVSSLLGAKFGMVVSIFDILKVFLPTLFFKLSYPDQPGLYLTVISGPFITDFMAVQGLRQLWADCSSLTQSQSSSHPSLDCF